MNYTKATSQAVAEWSRVFPKQATENYTSSVTFMKQLTVVAISTITYLKSAFPKDSYMVESFGGIRLRILKAKCRNEFAQFLSTSLTQAFEAFDKRYLHQLALCFYEEECSVESLIEYHIFEYSYHSDGVTMSMHSKNQDNIKHTAKFTFDNVRKKTINMIKSCVVLMESCQNKLPSTYNVSLRLYYNEDAPWDYQAPGFLATDEGEDHLAGRLTDTIRLGWVETAYHKLLARSYIKDTAKASHEAIASQNPPEITSEEVEQSDALSDGKREGMAADVSETQLRCPCNLQEDSRGPMPAFLTCHYCRTRQHAACFGVRSAQAALVTRHCCADCHYAVRARLATDDKLASLSTRKRESLCIFRRTLEWCSQVPEVDAAALVNKFGISDMSALKLMKLLLSHKVIQPQSDRNNNFNAPHEIKEDQLKSVINRFFQSTDEGNTGDEMEVEMLALQVSNNTVATSEVLSELKNVSLQEAANTSQLIHQANGVTNIEGDEVMEESTLDQYTVKLKPNKEMTHYDTEKPDRSVKRRIGNKEAEVTASSSIVISRRPGLRSGTKIKRVGTLDE